MSFIGGVIGGVVGSMVAGPKNNGAVNQARFVLRDGADLLYYNTELDESQRVFGMPGASLYHANLDDASALQAGIEGEKRVAAELEKLAALYPNTYVFHSVKMPGAIGDMDHIVVQGNRALLVDSKNWRRNASYTLSEIWDDGDVVFRDGEQFSGGEIHLRRQLVEWQMLFINSDVNMSAALVIANHESSAVQTVDTGYTFMNIRGLAGMFNAVFTEEYVPVLSPEMLRYYCNMVQNPYFDPNDMTNYVQVGGDIPVSYVVPVKQPSTRMSKWLVFWSVMNYLLMPFIFPAAGISAIPLIIVAHRHRSTIRKNGLGGSGLVTATLVFTYILLAVWALGTALVASYYLFMPSILGI